MIQTLTLRWAEADDHQAIVTLLNEMHAEIGAFPLSHAKLTAHVGEVLTSGRAMLAEIDGELIGSIGLLGTEPWYSEQKIISDYWIFVSRETPKRLTVFRAMVAEVQTYARDVGIPLVLALYSSKDRTRKAKLFERWGDQIMRGFQFTDVGGEYRVQ